MGTYNDETLFTNVIKQTKVSSSIFGTGLLKKFSKLSRLFWRGPLHKMKLYCSKNNSRELINYIAALLPASRYHGVGERVPEEQCRPSLRRRRQRAGGGCVGSSLDNSQRWRAGCCSISRVIYTSGSGCPALIPQTMHRGCERAPFKLSFIGIWQQ